MTASLLIAIGLLIFLIGIGIGIGLAVRFIHDLIADRITDTDHDMIGGNPL